MIRYRIVAADGRTLAVTASCERAEQRRRPGDTVLTEDVLPIGRIGDAITGRVLWVDGLSCSATDETDAVPAVGGPAGELLSAVLGSDHPWCDAIGGPLVLVAVRELTRTVVAKDPRPTRGGYQSPRVERLDVQLEDGTRHSWFAAEVGYSEGYLYAIRPTYGAAVAELDDVDAQLEMVS